MSAAVPLTYAAVTGRKFTIEEEPLWCKMATSQAFRTKAKLAAVLLYL